MALFNITHERYYNNSVNFTGDGTTTTFTITTAALDPIPAAKADIDIYVNGKEVSVGNYAYNNSSGVVTFSGNTNNTDI